MWFAVAVSAALIVAIWMPWFLQPTQRKSALETKWNYTMVGGHVMKIKERLHIDFHDDGYDGVLLSASLGLNMSEKQRISCQNDKRQSNMSCLWDHEGNSVQISMMPTTARLKCTNFVWVAVSPKDILKDCFRLRDAHWFGGGAHFDQSWPIQKVARAEAPFVTGDFLQRSLGHHGSVGERFWLSNKGIAIVVNPNVPLFVSLNQSNDGRLCLVGKNGSPYRNTRRTPPSLDYIVCVGKNLLSVYKDVYKMFYSFPVNIPDRQLIVNPIWSTWANFGSAVSQDKIERLAHEIDKFEFPRGIISIDDKWEYCYGDMVFDVERFPQPDVLIRKLESYGFRVSLWIHPFSNDDCVTFREGLAKNYWVTKGNASEVGHVRWWNGRGGLLDVTNPDAIKWWLGRLTKLQSNYGIYSFKFDAGESTWLPYDSKLSILDESYPNAYSTKYAESVASTFGRSIELRVGCRTQHLPVFVRMMDKNSVWNASNGLRTIIPTALHFGLMGYPFVLPDMVGGNGYDPHFPSRELLVRWFQLNVFLPAIQISILPWSERFDERVVHMCRKAMKIRSRFTPLIVSLAQEAARSGSPIIRPLWWISPNDKTTHDIDSEFLLGDSVLVAPILDAGAVRRNIYLPKGMWFDELRDGVLHGPQWLINYRVHLSEIAFFTRLPKPTVNKASRL